jgi:PAS domain S-box-containing protein
MGQSNDSTSREPNDRLLDASEDRFRLIADNAADVIWTSHFAISDLARSATAEDVQMLVDVILERWRFSFVSPAAKRILGYTADEALERSLRDIATPASYARIREAMIQELSLKPAEPQSTSQRPALEVEFLAKDGSSRWCEVVATYFWDEAGLPASMLGITRDISQRREAERALRESENKLRTLLENLPDLVLVVDRNAIIQFANRGLPDIDRQALLGACGFDHIVPECRDACRRALDQAFASGLPQTCESEDILGTCWSIQFVPLTIDGDLQQALLICTDVTAERSAAEAVKKEQRLLQRLLDLHERERQLMAYEIHDGFAQQVAGAMYRLQAFRETFARNPDEAWKVFDSAVKLLGRAIDETRRLISGLRPPILDEAGIVEAVDYLVCEHRQHGGPQIEFQQDVSFTRLAPPLESAIFRIIQESLQNACRHSQSERVSVSLVQRDHRIRIEVQDWGIGFDPDAVHENRFGLQGIRERARLLDGSVTIRSAPAKGTLIAVELPVLESAIQPPTKPITWD